MPPKMGIDKKLEEIQATFNQKLNIIKSEFNKTIKELLETATKEIFILNTHEKLVEIMWIMDNNYDEMNPESRE